jgi:hypothetical protein
MTAGLKIKNIKKIESKNTPVFDFEVEDAHHYILGDGTVSHNSYVPTKEMSGGSGLKYTASTIVMLSKKKDKDGTEVIGNIIRAKLVKSRLTKENSQTEVRLSYKSGLDRYYGLLDIAEKYDIIKKVSTRYELPDGSKVFGKNINEDPEKYFTQEVLNQIDEACKKEFLYGQDGIGGATEDEEMTNENE